MLSGIKLFIKLFSAEFTSAKLITFAKRVKEKFEFRQLETITSIKQKYQILSLNRCLLRNNSDQVSNFEVSTYLERFDILTNLSILDLIDMLFYKICFGKYVKRFHILLCIQFDET